jgi:hypothetical protein
MRGHAPIGPAAYAAGPRPGVHPRSCLPRCRTSPDGPAPTPGTPCGPGSLRTPAWRTRPDRAKRRPCRWGRTARDRRDGRPRCRASPAAPPASRDADWGFSWPRPWPPGRSFRAGHAGGGHDGSGPRTGEEIPCLPRVVGGVPARDEDLLGDGSLKRSVAVAGDGVRTGHWFHRCRRNACGSAMRVRARLSRSRVTAGPAELVSEGSRPRMR